MKGLREYITESEQWIDSPAPGDDFAINIREDVLLETYILEADDDRIVLASDDELVTVLEEYGMLDELESMEEGDVEGVQDSQAEKDFFNFIKLYDNPNDQPSMDIALQNVAYRNRTYDDIETGERILAYAKSNPQDVGTVGTDARYALKELMDYLRQDVAEGSQDDVSEAEYRGRKVPLGKPMAGDVKKRKVYVRKPNGNVVKVEFGDKTMRIKKSNPKRRKSFRARHNCANPGPRWKARYWSCRAW